ncbi:hypothetical protein EAI_15969 [Harpegnathos saltator]|uniref:Uncharacterized protein n=1 Tax=Harpegnathos saltator TaxID=610380 RepID=E2BAE4_HARSA|nr:hypothetical protein EAI_15969 [Harpegnathos saltator]
MDTTAKNGLLIIETTLSAGKLLGYFEPFGSHCFVRISGIFWKRKTVKINQIKLKDKVKYFKLKIQGSKFIILHVIIRLMRIIDDRATEKEKKSAAAAEEKEEEEEEEEEEVEREEGLRSGEGCLGSA